MKSDLKKSAIQSFVFAGIELLLGIVFLVLDSKQYLAGDGEDGQ